MCINDFHLEPAKMENHKRANEIILVDLTKHNRAQPQVILKLYLESLREWLGETFVSMNWANRIKATIFAVFYCDFQDFCVEYNAREK